ncbi:hypothetical protein, partial [Acinetobacter baumannii]|uniref:hypothetical protein n=1 Tax=Acinetobacter baumannii TaxID=470 RepID=UPI001C076E80
MKLIHRITCNSCFQSHSSESSTLVLSLPLGKDIQSSVSKFSETQVLQDDDAPFCYICSKACDSDSRFSVGEVGSFLVVQLNRFTSSEGSVSKNLSPVIVNQTISVLTEVDEEVSCRKT